MGGYGSGNGRFASQMDEFLKLDLASFKPNWFQCGYSGSLTWSRGGHKTGSIGYRLGVDFMVLNYTAGQEPDRVTISDRFEMEFTDQPFGGRRRWIVCNGCRRRCRVLIGGRYFRCRLCYDATYPSQYERFRVVGLHKAETARERLGADPGISKPLPPKPKGMHWRTYRKLQEINWDAQLAIDRALAGYFGR